MASRRLNTQSIDEPGVVDTGAPKEEAPKNGSAFGFDLNILKPFRGKDDLPKATYRMKKQGDQEIEIFVKAGEPRFFVNKNKVIMVRMGRHRVERRFFARIYDKTERGMAFVRELQKRGIPGI